MILVLTQIESIVLNNLSTKYKLNVKNHRKTPDENLV